MDPSSRHFEDEAERAIDSILIAQPANYHAIYGKALIFFNAGKIRECLEQLEKVLDRQPWAKVMKLKESAEKLLASLEKKARGDFATAKPPAASKKKGFWCPTCNNSFCTQYSLRRHMNLHTGNRPWKCPICSKSFIQKMDCQRHLTVHSDEYNFGCSVCTKVFKTKKNLSAHMQLHSTDRPHKCTVCERQFKLKRVLRTHEQIHEKVKPFSCGECGKDFTSKAYIRSHMKVHETARPFECSYCGSTFKRKHDWGFHVAHQHPSDFAKSRPAH